jgi:uncharacterized membrane protein YhaH (DUF805 family)
MRDCGAQEKRRPAQGTAWAIACHALFRPQWLPRFIPVVGFIILPVWYCQPGTQGANRFGQVSALQPRTASRGRRQNGDR